MNILFRLMRLSALVMIVHLFSATNLTAQTKRDNAVVLENLPELKKFEYLPDVVQDMPLDFRYFNGRDNVKSSFRALKENFVQLFFWDASYANHYTDLQKIYNYKEEMGAMSTFILVISKSDKSTLSEVQASLDRFKKEYEIDMDIAFVIGNPNLNKLFKMDVFPKYVQINQDAVFIKESGVDQILKNRAPKK